MTTEWLSELHEWHDFYLLVGTAAAALTGLLFVVISIGPHVVSRRGGAGTRAFVTPIVVHFASVVIASAIMLVPTVHPALLALLLAAGSAIVLAYLFVIGVHRQWRESKLDREDWAGYVALPVLSYLLILAGALSMAFESGVGFGTVGAASVLLLAVSIRNAWDLILWMARQSR